MEMPNDKAIATANGAMTNHLIGFNFQPTASCNWTLSPFIGFPPLSVRCFDKSSPLGLS
jgi:hypothetical protein